MPGERVSATELHRMLQENVDVTVVDVRPKERFANGHVPGALNIPLASIEERIPDLPKDRPVITYCGGGMSGPAAAKLLSEAGYNVRVMEGFRAWEAANLPYDKK